MRRRLILNFSICYLVDPIDSSRSSRKKPRTSREAWRGLIVNVSSVAGKKGWAGASAYCASKFGLAGFSQALADEGRAHGIRAVVLYPGAMATSWGAWSPEERREMEREDAPPAQVLPPGEVAAFIAWLAASPPEFVLTEGIITPIEEGLP